MFRVEAPLTNHFRDYGPDLKKYKAMQKIPYRKTKIGGLQFFNNSIP